MIRLEHSADESDHPWAVDLICCGRDDGTYLARTWDDADAFRKAYTSGAGVSDATKPANAVGGHERSAIIRGTATFQPSSARDPESPRTP
jgi:hypothetical protein